MLLCERFLIFQQLLQILPCAHDIFIGGYGGGDGATPNNYLDESIRRFWWFTLDSNPIIPTRLYEIVAAT